MKILLTGGAGYLGSILVPKLLLRGHDVRIIDIGYFGLDHLRMYQSKVEVIQEDLRRILVDAPFTSTLLHGIDCIIHLAGISNDPSAELNPRLTEEVNYLATVALAKAAKDRRIKLLFSSSCSVYGQADGQLTENSVQNPLTTYAVSKVRAEQVLDEMADAHWQPVVLRNGTLFGYSPRMRFDLVVNTFALHSCLQNQIRIFGEGKQWRPYLQVSDCATAFLYFAECARLPHLTVNVASENLRVTDVAAIMEILVPGLNVSFVPSANPDLRDYRVSTERMREWGFQPSVSLKEGAIEILDAIRSGKIADLESPCHWNARWVKTLAVFGNEEYMLPPAADTKATFHTAGSGD
jgi:nucleoside-diphosphate-sugar epimerase